MTDDDFSLNCLAANLSQKSKYITVFPTDCSAKIADTLFCIQNFDNYVAPYVDLTEQMDLLFDPVFEDIQTNNVIKKLNEITSEISVLNMEESYLGLFSTLWYMGIPCFDSIEVKEHYGKGQFYFKLFFLTLSHKI